MGDMLVAYEDDVPKDRGLKVSGHCALDSGLGCANTFAPYCIPPRQKYEGHLSVSIVVKVFRRSGQMGPVNIVCARHPAR